MRPTSPRGTIPTPITAFRPLNQNGAYPAATLPTTPTATSASPMMMTRDSPNVRISTAAPTETKKIGTKKWPRRTTPRSMAGAWTVGAKASPAVKAPMMSADPTRSARTAVRNASASANVASACSEPRRANAPKTGGTASRPTSNAAATNPNAIAVMSATLPTDRVAPPTICATTARMIRPTMSSSTAAPSTTCDSRSCSRPRSASTRAVMPTDVAVSDAPTTRAGSSGSPSCVATRYPRAKGRTTPTRATVAAAPPTERSRRRSVSSPMWNRRMRTPISASTCSTGRPGSTSPRIDGPRRTPASNSPTTAGCPKRSASSPSALAAMRIAASTTSTVVTGTSAAETAAASIISLRSGRRIEEGAQLHDRCGEEARARRTDGDAHRHLRERRERPDPRQLLGPDHHVHEARLRERAADQHVGLTRRHLRTELVGNCGRDELHPPVYDLSHVALGIGAHFRGAHAEERRVSGDLHVALANPYLRLYAEPLAVPAQHPRGRARLHGADLRRARGRKHRRGSRHLDALRLLRGGCLQRRRRGGGRIHRSIGSRTTRGAVRRRGRRRAQRPGRHPDRAPHMCPCAPGRHAVQQHSLLQPCDLLATRSLAQNHVGRLDREVEPVATLRRHEIRGNPAIEHDFGPAPLLTPHGERGRFRQSRERGAGRRAVQRRRRERPLLRGCARRKRAGNNGANHDATGW